MIINIFLNGGGMRGGPVHDHIADEARFLGRVRTAARYRFYSVRDEYPGLAPDTTGLRGGSVVGELYELPLEALRVKLLPQEPAELELGVIELEDGRSTLGMVLREEHRDAPGVVDITEHGGWRAYRGEPDPTDGEAATASGATTPGAR